jgi:16S rRNA (cytosine1402-N4)-methyltransferase
MVLTEELHMLHMPVMLGEVVNHLLHAHSMRIFDATVGCGGHARVILEAKSDIELIGVDRDDQALREARMHLADHRRRVHLMKGSYSELDRLLGPFGAVDGVLLDLGLSSMQLDDASRGFSHMNEGPLDMRMGDDGDTAKSMIESVDLEDLSRMLRRYGEVGAARRIARAIKEAASRGDMNTTFDLKRAVESVLRSKSSVGLLSRVFQAVRISVNRELENLQVFLAGILRYVNKNGRLVFISYHSLEDRMVKTFLKRESASCLCPPGLPVCTCGHEATLELLTRRAVKPSRGEIDTNPRSRSARLRAARALGRGE